MQLYRCHKYKWRKDRLENFSSFFLFSYMDRIQAIKDLLLASPNDSFLEHAMALEYVKLGHDGEARMWFEKLLARDPGYVGSYYHLAKLLERIGDIEMANQWYVAGMSAAETAGNRHAFSELKMAYEELNF
jgi:tetratricopeptide (TPR) repeat protein